MDSNKNMPNFRAYIDDTVDELNKALQYEYHMKNWADKTYGDLKEKIRDAVESTGENISSEKIEMLANSIRSELLKDIITRDLI